MTGAPVDGAVTPRRFVLLRHTDVTGVSGVGVVAEGIQFTDGTLSLRWRGAWPVTAVWPSIAGVIAVHGHVGATEVRWIDAEPPAPSRTAPPPTPPGPDPADWYGRFDWGTHDDPEMNP